MSYIPNNRFVALNGEILEGKKQISDAIIAKGGISDPEHTFSQLAGDVMNIPLQPKEMNADMELSDLFAFINTKNNDTYKGYIAYMWEAIDDTFTFICPSADLIYLSDGTITTEGGTKTIQILPKQRFYFALLLYREGNTTQAYTQIGTARELNRVIIGGEMTITSLGGFQAYNSTTLELGKDVVIVDLSANAFYSNTHLNRVYMDLQTISNVYTFYGCTNLTSVEMPNLQTISDSGTFSGCPNLTSVEMPNLQTISSVSTFYGCTNLTSVELPNLQTIGGYYTFYICPNLTSVEMPNLQTISDSGTFYGCTNLTSVEFGKLLSFFSAGQFSGCPILAKIKIGAGTDINLNFSSWSPTAIPSSEDAQFNVDFMAGIVENLYDYTGGEAHTLTLSANVLGRLTQETLDALADKNWNVL